MSAKTDAIVRNLMESIKNVGTEKTSAFDSVATVKRIENGIAWVHFDGGVEETPARLTIDAKVGEQVQVRVSDGVAFLVGNVSAPPTDDTAALVAQNAANQAVESANIAFRAASTAIEDAAMANEAANTAMGAATQAQNAASQASEDAATAQTSANQAIQDAATASSAANAAQSSANQAIQDAATAQTAAISAGTAASNAQTSANTANTAANSALTQLSAVEDVLGALNWISQHGVYVASADTEVVPGKYYFIRSGSGTEVDPYTYSIVVNPTGNPSTNNYYELDSIDEAISNYIATHLALTDEGLWVLSDDTGYKLLVSNTGIRLYDDNGVLIAEYSGDIKLGDSSKGQIRVSSDGLKMIDSKGIPFFEVFNEKDSVQKTVTEYNLTDSYVTNSKAIAGSSIYVHVTYYRSGSGRTGFGYYFTAGTTSHISANGIRINYKSNENNETITVIATQSQVSLPIVDRVEYTTTVDKLFYTIGRRTGEAGVDSIVIGENCEASADNSYAEGCDTKAGGLYSHAQNLGTVANGEGQTVVGKYNVVDNSNKYAFIVGNGTGNGNRSNALAIDWEGNIEAAGGGGSNNYNDLINKPQIESNILTGDKTFEELGLEPIDYIHFNWN